MVFQLPESERFFPTSEIADAWYGSCSTILLRVLKETNPVTSVTSRWQTAWWLSVLVALLAATPAAATTIDYGTFAGTTVNFSGPNNGFCLGGVCETPNSGATGLFGAPTVSGDQLLFFPSAFSASASGVLGFGSAGSQLQVTIASANPLIDTLDQLNINEFGDALLLGLGTASTGTFAGMSGVVTVTEVLGVSVTPVIFGWTGTITPSDTLALPGDGGVTIWSGSAAIDVASVVANATKLTLSFDNNLYAFSEAGTSAFIQKKVVSGPAVTISVVPEPGTLILLCGGLLGMAVRARRALFD